MRTKQDYLDLLQETLDYYTEDPSRRAMIENEYGGLVCQYLTPDGKMCAVGRCLEPDVRKRYADKTVGAIGLLNNEGQEALLEQYRGFDPTFWNDIQVLHDTRIYDSGSYDEGYVSLLKGRILSKDYYKTKD